LPPGHPTVAPGAAAPSTDELLRRLDATPDLKSRPKPFEVSAALGKLYYSRGRWKDAAEAFRQTGETAAPLRAFFLAERARTKGALPPADAVNCRLSADAAVELIATAPGGLPAASTGRRRLCAGGAAGRPSRRAACWDIPWR
jgi:hypothetical protein